MARTWSSSSTSTRNCPDRRIWLGSRPTSAQCWSRIVDDAATSSGLPPAAFHTSAYSPVIRSVRFGPGPHSCICRGVPRPRFGPGAADPDRRVGLLDRLWLGDGVLQPVMLALEG